MNTKLLSGLTLACFATLGSGARAAGSARNIIFFLGDGMGATTVTASRIYKYGETGALHMESLERTARIKTYSLDAQTTDSAPSMAAYMTGVKMRNEVISMSPDTIADTTRCTAGNGTPVATLLELAKADGRAVGVVTTTEVTHATPAATYAHICHRDLAYDIAGQATPGFTTYNPALGSGLDVLFGGGRNYFTPKDATTNPYGRPDGADLVALFVAAGYVSVSDTTGLSGVPTTATKVLGLFSPTGHMSYELDRDPSLQPSLSQMTTKAIEVLQRASTKGFFLMVEGGRIDHALHATNAKRALEDTIAFDDAIQAALGAVSLADTLVVVTADHDHTMVINGYPKVGNPILDIVRDVTGQESKDADGFTFTTLAFGNGSNRPDLRTNVDSAVALGPDYKQEAGVRLSSETHGGTDVMLMATGAGSAAFKGTMVNTSVFPLLKSAFGY